MEMKVMEGKEMKGRSIMKMKGQTTNKNFERKKVERFLCSTVYTPL